MKTTFQIGMCAFAICTDFWINWGKNAAIFIVHDKGEEEIDVCYNFQQIEQLQLFEGNRILKRDDVEIWQTDNGELRRYNIAGDRNPFAISQNNQIRYDRRYLEWIMNDKNLFSLLSLEKLMLSYNSLILHSSYIVYKGNAILFTAPSGTGKSTQADLWQKYRGAEIINGDRSLLHYDVESDLWVADGWPFSGSSTFCQKRKTPIKAIVYLSQSGENIIQKSSPAKSVKRLLSETTINFWNVDFVNTVVNELEKLIFSVPCYYLKCTPDERAVECLEKVIERSL